MAIETAVGVKLIEALKRNNWLKINRFCQLFPMRCVLCGTPSSMQRLCPGCVGDLPWRRHMRLQPAGPIQRHASFHYHFPLVEMIGRGKFASEPGLMRLLGELMASRPAIESGMFDAVCAVPLPYWRSVRRGFNQAREIARPIAEALDLPLVEALVREGGGRTQQGLGRGARLRNPAGRFRAVPAAVGKRLLLIDDVTTTGTTLREAGHTLLRAGARTAVAWSACAVD